MAGTVALFRCLVRSPRLDFVLIRADYKKIEEGNCEQFKDFSSRHVFVAPVVAMFSCGSNGSPAGPGNGGDASSSGGTSSGRDGSGGNTSSSSGGHIDADAQVIPYPPYLRAAAAAYWSVRHKPMIHGLLEVDVTKPRALLRERHARSGESPSFTAFLARCLAKAVDEDKSVQAFRQGKRLVVFEDVDVATRIEHDVAGQKYVIPYILRAANRKTVRELREEIRAAQRADVRQALSRFRLLPIALYGHSSGPSLPSRGAIRASGRRRWGRSASRPWACLAMEPGGESLRRLQPRSW